MDSKRPKYQHSYGRKQMRGLRGVQAERMENLLPKVAITLPEKGELALPQKPVWLEIGYGAGEHMSAQAKAHPEIHYIGCEVFTNGIASALRHIEKNNLENVNLFTEDARLLLEKLPEHSLDRVFILFPDPWPKRKHNKRRLINIETLTLLYRAMKPASSLRLATDDKEYAVWMLVKMMEEQDKNRFRWLATRAADFKPTPADHVTTRYETKAKIQGRDAVFLDFVRV